MPERALVSSGHSYFFDHVKLFSVNSNRLNAKTKSVRDVTCRHDLDFVHSTEAGLQQEAEPKIKGFTPFRANHRNYNRGSIIYVRDGYIANILRISENEKMQWKVNSFS